MYRLVLSTDAGTMGWFGARTWNPRNMKVRTRRARSARSFFKHTMMWVHFRTSSAYSSTDTNPSFEPSGKRHVGTCMYRRCCHNTVSQQTSVFCARCNTNVSRTPWPARPSSSCTASRLTESSLGFPTPLPSVLKGEDGVTQAAWGTSGPPPRPSAKGYGKVVTWLGVTIIN